MTCDVQAVARGSSTVHSYAKCTHSPTLSFFDGLVCQYFKNIGSLWYSLDSITQWRLVFLTFIQDLQILQSPVDLVAAKAKSRLKDIMVVIRRIIIVSNFKRISITAGSCLSHVKGLGGGGFGVVGEGWFSLNLGRGRVSQRLEIWKRLAWRLFHGRRWNTSHS